MKTILALLLFTATASAFDLSNVTDKSQVAAIAIAREAHNATQDPKDAIASDEAYLDYLIRSMLTNLAQRMGTDVDYDAAIADLTAKRDAIAEKGKK